MVMWDGESMHEGASEVYASSQEVEPWPEYQGELCGACQERYLTVYKLPDDVWDQVSAGANMLCPKCADGRARKLGIELYWEAKVGEYPLDSYRRIQRIVAETRPILDRLADS